MYCAIIDISRFFIILYVFVPLFVKIITVSDDG